MAKKPSLPVAKSKAPVAVKIVSDAPTESKGYEERERKYRAESALRTLAEAEEIRKNKELMRDVKQCAKNMAKAVCK
jgi:hypothetical protein